jgi:hypothetical protein
MSQPLIELWIGDAHPSQSAMCERIESSDRSGDRSCRSETTIRPAV